MPLKISKSGNSYCIDSISRGFLIPPSVFSSFSDELTIEAWIRLVGDCPSSVPIGSMYYFDLFILTPSSLLSRLYIDNGFRRMTSTVSKNLQDEEFHFAFTYSSSDGYMRHYVDGLEVGSSQLTGLASYTLNTSEPVGLYFGGRESLGERFFGYVDEVRIYNRRLSDDEVKINFSGPVVKAGLIVRLKIDQTSGTKLIDSSGNGNDATIEDGRFTCLAPLR